MFKMLTAGVAAMAMFFLCTRDAPVSVSTAYKDIGIRGIVHHSDGSVCGNAWVTIGAKGVVPDTAPYAFKTFSRITTTDEMGRYSFGNSVEPGLYVVDVWSDVDAALIDSVMVAKNGSDMVLADAMLRPSGAIRGKVRLPEDDGAVSAYALAFGIDRFTKTDKNGAFVMANLAAGTYSLRFVAGTEVYRFTDTIAIEVRSAETTSIGTITLPYRDTLISHDFKLVCDTMTQRVTLSWNMIGDKAVDRFDIIRKNTLFDSVFAPETSKVDRSAGTFIDSTCLQDHNYEYRVQAIYKDTAQMYKNCISRAQGVTISSYLTVNSIYNTPGTMELSGFDVTPTGVVYRQFSSDSSVRVLDSLMRETKRFSPGFKQSGFLRVIDSQLFIRQLDENTQRYNMLRYSTEGVLLDTLVSQAAASMVDVNHGLFAMAGIPDSLGNGDSVTVMSLDGTLKLAWPYEHGLWCMGICVADTNRIYLALGTGPGKFNKIVTYDRSGTVVAENNLPDITMFNAMTYDIQRQRLYISCDDRITFMTGGGEPDPTNRMIGMVRVYDSKFSLMALYRVMNGNVLSTMTLRRDGRLYLGVMGAGSTAGSVSDRLIRFNPAGR